MAKNNTKPKSKEGTHKSITPQNRILINCKLLSKEKLSSSFCDTNNVSKRFMGCMGNTISKGTLIKIYKHMISKMSCDLSICHSWGTLSKVNMNNS